MKYAGLLATVATAKVYFSDDFSSLDKWVQSEWKSGPEMGKFEVSAGKVNADEKEDLSIASKVDARFYAASASFDSFSNKELKELIIQYQVKYEQNVDCGGGYIKIGPKMEDPTKFGDPTKYYIMFGPDKCGSTSRTHLIFTTPEGKNSLKTVDLPYRQSDVHKPTVYRLTILPDNKVKVEIDKEVVYEGKIDEDWDMGLGPKEIDDPEDSKPEDWVEEAMMLDPEDKKPEDWVDGPEKIADPEAKMPDDWNADEDGEWEAPLVKNPAYKGEWEQKKIANPDYKGPWAPKKIANPEYKENKYLNVYEDFGFVGFDLWQVKSGSHFDNLIITDDVAEADALYAKWEALKAVEPPKEAEPASNEDEDLDAEDDLDAEEDL